MNQNRLKTALEFGRESNDVTYIMFNAFRLNNNHAIEYILNNYQDKKNRSIILINPHESNQRNLEFFTKGISNYKKALLPLFNEIHLLDRNNVTLLEVLNNTSSVVMDMPYLKEEKDFYQNILSFCDRNHIIKYECKNSGHTKQHT